MLCCLSFFVCWRVCLLDGWCVGRFFVSACVLLCLCAFGVRVCLRAFACCVCVLCVRVFSFVCGVCVWSVSCVRVSAHVVGLAG